MLKTQLEKKLKTTATNTANSSDFWLSQLGSLSEQTNPAAYPIRDAFGRGRVGLPFTDFDSKLLGDNRALFWDDQETSGGGTNSVYSSARASVTLSVSASTAGKRVRQTFQRFNYQPGKSRLVLTTNVLGNPASGITKRFGYFDENNGTFFQLDETGLSVVVRSNRSGSPVDTIIPQDLWNINNLTGKKSDNFIDLNTNNSNIYFIDLEWLGVGEVRFGVVIGGLPIYVHQERHANKETGVYMSTPNLPIRYEIENDGTGPADTLEGICNSVITEGGQEETGVFRSISTGATSLSASAAGTSYAMFGVRLKTTHLDNIVKLAKVSVIATSNDDFEWRIMLNPNVAGTFNYADVTNSALQAVAGATANVVTGGTLIDSGWGKAGATSTELVETLRYLGSAIDGTRDTMVLAIRPVGNAAVFYGSLGWKEFA